MKKLFFIFSLLVFSAFANAQTWVPVGNGVNGYINTLYVYDSVMYAGGKFTSPGNNIAQWNGSNWDSLSSGTNNEVSAVGNYKGLLYMGGWFSEAGGHSAGSIATWNGSAFFSLPFTFQDGIVHVIQAYDSLLYIGGSFDSVNHKRPSGLVTWDGEKTDSLNIAYGGDWLNVSILTTYNNLLYLGFAPGYNNGQPLGIWNNRDISYENYDFYTPPFVEITMNAFCQVDTDLYLGGYFLYYEDLDTTHPVKDTVNNIAMWNGHTWSALGKGINGTVNALVSYNNLIVAGGSFDSAGGISVNNIAAWDGTKWSALGNGVNGTVYALAVFDSNLYAGGDFNSPGSGIAEFNPTLKIAPAVINNDSVNVFPNPNNGQFTIVCNRAITSGSQPIIEIYNLLGEKIYSANLADGNTAINLEGLTAGIYIYRITSSGNNLINPGKLAIE